MVVTEKLQESYWVAWLHCISGGLHVRCRPCPDWLGCTPGCVLECLPPWGSVRLRGVAYSHLGIRSGDEAWRVRVGTGGVEGVVKRVPRVVSRG